jgi:hypothetical protein
MGRLLRILYLALPIHFFDTLFNHDAHSIISSRGRKILSEQHESNHCGK